MKIIFAALDVDVEIAGYNDLAFVERNDFEILLQHGEKRSVIFNEPGR